MSLVAAAQQFGSEGTEFYVSIIPNLVSETCEITLSSATNTSVLIESPGKGYSNNVNLTANTPTTVTIPNGYLVPKIGDRVDSLLLHITANDPISVYLLNFAGATADGALAYPVNTYGSEYYTSGYEGFSNDCFIIIATEDNTIVEITPKVTTQGGHPANVPYTVTLNKGQEYMEYGKQNTATTGSYIREVNGKKIAVICGTKCTNVPFGCAACDVIFEQMIPISKLGKKYLLAPLATDTLTPAYTYRIISTTDSNKIYLNGVLYDTLQKGEVANHNHETGAICLTSEYPIMVVQYTQGIICVKVGDPAMIVVPPVEQFIDRVNYATPTYVGFREHYIYILTETASVGTVNLNGTAIAQASFKPFPSCNTYSYATVKIPVGSYLVNCPKGFIMIAYGYGNAISYGYIGGSNFKNLKFDIKINGGTCGDLDYGIQNIGDTAEIISSHWDFGDGTTDTGLYVNKSYAQHGTYNVTNIIVADRKKPYTDTLTQTIRTKPIPVADFVINNNSQCVKENHFVFTDSSKYPNGSAKSQSFWMIDSNIILQDSVMATSTFNQSGTYTVKLISVSNNSCVDTLEKPITVKYSAKADFSVQDSALCLKGNLFKTTQLSSINSAESITAYKWDFSDNSTTAATQPTKSFTDTGLYTLSLIAYAGNNCHDTIEKQVRVLPSPKAVYNAQNVCDRDSVRFNNTSTPNGSAQLNYTWDFGDGNTDTITLAPKKLYPDSGVFITSLFIGNEFGCTDSTTQNITIYPKPQAQFSKQGRCINLPTNFTDNSIRFGTPVQQNQWFFDAAPPQSNTGNISTIYTTTGKKNITLITTDINGCADTVTQSLYINPSPTVDFLLDKTAQCFKGNEFLAVNKTQISEGKVRRIGWYIDDVRMSDTNVFNFKLPAWGQYTLKLKAETDSLCNDSIEQTLTVHPQTNLDIQVNDSVQCAQQNLFSFTNNSYTPLGNTNYLWQVSTGSNYVGNTLPQQQFAQAGGYFVNVFAETDRGCKDTTRMILKVLFNPTVDFTTKNICSNDSAFFTNTSSYAGGSTAKWLWKFGDGQTATRKEPWHFYTAPGYYKVTLIGESSEGCSDTLVRDSAIRVVQAPTAYFNVASSQNLNNIIKVAFNNLTQNATGYYWTFGNGQFSPQKEAKTQYNDTGKFKVSLFAVNDDNCTDFYDSILYLAPEIDLVIPNAFTPNKDPLNPVFKIEGSYYYNSFLMQVFDRWGGVVFSSDDAAIGWDGNFKGEAAPEDVYTYSVRIIDINYKLYVFNGTVHLIR